MKTLLLEDDTLTQRFVCMALDGTDNKVITCQNVNQALLALSSHQFDFILTDLMLPGESGMSFIQRLIADPSLAKGAQIVALSAGIDASIAAELDQLGVQNQLLKPVSVVDLRAVFQTKLSQNDPIKEAAQHAVEQYFGGQHALFDQFKKQSHTLLADDIKKGDSFFDASDYPALHQLAHSLKSVLQLLGQENAHALARKLEHSLALTPMPATMEIAGHWQALKAELLNLTGNPD